MDAQVLSSQKVRGVKALASAANGDTLLLLNDDNTVSAMPSDSSSAPQLDSTLVSEEERSSYGDLFLS